LLLQQLHGWLQLQLGLAVRHGAAQGQLLLLEGMQQCAGHAAPADCVAAGTYRTATECETTHEDTGTVLDLQAWSESAFADDMMHAM
jgi:hypothetical protein